MKPCIDIMHAKSMAMTTLTTNTLTPTTLKTITQIFESDECLNNLQKMDETGGGFQPPSASDSVNTRNETSEEFENTTFLNLVPTSTESFSQGIKTRTSYSNLDKRSWQGGVTTVVTPSKAVSFLGEVASEEDEDEEYKDDDKDEDYEPEMKRRSARFTATKSTPVVIERMQSQPKRKSNKGGRKPAGSRAIDETALNPVEAKKLNVRRQRNKEAAARCRKRRMDLTEKLQAEVDVWETKKKSLEEEIQMLRGQRDELEFILSSHIQVCPVVKLQGGSDQHQPVVVAIKSEPESVIVEPVNAQYEVAQERQARPASLPIAKANSPKVNGVEIETPSTIIPNLCFDSIVSTGLTPTVVYSASVSSMASPLNTPTCSRQHQQMGSQAVNPREYVQL